MRTGSDSSGLRARRHDLRDVDPAGGAQTTPRPEIALVDNFIAGTCTSTKGRDQGSRLQAGADARRAVASGALPPLEKRFAASARTCWSCWPRDTIGSYGGTISLQRHQPATPSAISAGRPGTCTSPASRPIGKRSYPDLARSVELSADNKVATVSLRRGLKWSDGQPLTADDIMFWYEDIATQPRPAAACRRSSSSAASPPSWRRSTTCTVTFTFAAPNPAFIRSASRASSPAFRSRLGTTCTKWHKKYNPDAGQAGQVGGLQLLGRCLPRPCRRPDRRQPARSRICRWQKPWVLSEVDRSATSTTAAIPTTGKSTPRATSFPIIDKQARMLISDPEVVKLNVQSGKLDYADKFAMPICRC